MGLLTVYSIKCAILLSLLYGIYLLTISRLKEISLRRALLEVIFILSFLLPLFVTDIISEREVNPVYNGAVEYMVHVDPSQISAAKSVSSVIYNIIFIIIVGGMAVMTIQTLRSIISLSLLSLRSKTIKVSGYKIKIIKEKLSTPFCFCGKIYLTEEESQNISGMILAHEESHIKHLHFFDLIIARIMQILQWWNPVIWIMSAELKEVHEYQSDSDVLKAGFDRKDYQYLLLGRAVANRHLNFVCEFKHKKLKNRLMMMNRERTAKKKVLPVVLFIPGVFIALLAISSPIVSSMTDDFSKISLLSYSIDTTPVVQVPPVPDSQNQQIVIENSVPLTGEKHIWIEDPAEGISDSNTGQTPYVIVNGVHFGSVTDDLDSNDIESITVRKDSRLHPGGIIEIQLKNGKEVHSERSVAKTVSEPDSLTVVAYGVTRKR